MGRFTCALLVTGLKGVELPVFGIASNASWTGTKHALVDVSNPSVEQIEAFINLYMDGKAEITYKSESKADLEKPDVDGFAKVGWGWGCCGVFCVYVGVSEIKKIMCHLLLTLNFPHPPLPPTPISPQTSARFLPQHAREVKNDVVVAVYADWSDKWAQTKVVLEKIGQVLEPLAGLQLYTYNIGKNRFTATDFGAAQSDYVNNKPWIVLFKSGIAGIGGG